MKIARSFATLKSALESEDPFIRLGAAIPILEPVVIPQGRHIDPSQYQFQARGHSMVFDGTLEQRRVPVFSGFKAGEITGSFGSNVVLPEWWGLEDWHHDRAINCAIKSHKPYDTGHTVSLASGRYDVSAPIDLRGSRSYLVGATSGGTDIATTPQWSASWESTRRFGPEKHASVIWIGGTAPGVQSFRTGVRGVSVNAWNGSRAHPGKHVSCISSTGYTEENTVVEDVLLSYFTGFGVGFCNSTGVATVNGFTLRNFWIVGAMGREAVPIYSPPHANVLAIRDGTVDVRVQNGNDFTWPQYGIVASGGHTVVDNVHVEGCQIALYGEAHDSPCSLSITNFDSNHLMEPGMTYYDDPLPRLPPPSLAQQRMEHPGANDPWYRQYSATVVLGRHPSAYASSKAYNMTAALANIRNYGRCQYLLRDGLYGVHHTPFGRGQYANAGTGAVAFYVRKEGFISQPEDALFPYPDGSGDSSTRNKLWTNEPGHTIGPL